MQIKNFSITRHFPFLISLSSIGRGDDLYLDYCISTPPQFNPLEEDLPLLKELFIEMIMTDYAVPDSIISLVSSEEYLKNTGQDFFEA